MTISADPILSNGVHLNEYLQGLGEVFRFNPGDTLWNQNEDTSWAMVVGTGVLKLQRQMPSGGQTILGLLKRGNIMGEELMLNNPKRFASCVALSHGKAFSIRKEHLANSLQRQDVSLAMIQLATERLQLTLTRMEELIDGPVEGRLASTLLRLGEAMGISDGRGIFIPVRLTRGELAELVGCRAETTTRLMTKWKRSGIVDTKREGIVIQNPDLLKEILKA